MLAEPEHVWAVPLEAMTTAERKAFEDGEGKGALVGWPEVGQPDDDTRRDRPGSVTTAGSSFKTVSTGIV